MPYKDRGRQLANMRLVNRIARIKKGIEDLKEESFNTLASVFVESLGYVAGLGVPDEFVGRSVRAVFAHRTEKLDKMDALATLLDAYAEYMHTGSMECLKKPENPEGHLIDDEAYLHLKNLVKNAREVFRKEYEGEKKNE